MFKNLLITGGCGFIGSNFIRWLFEKSDFSGRVINVDSLTYAANPKNLQGMNYEAGRYVFSHTDIRNREAINKIFDDYEIDGVCHFAAESHVDRSIVSPDSFITTNIIGTFELLEATRARKERIQRFHHISTDEVYGSLEESGLFTETTPYDPSSPYSASKASSDHLVRAYNRTYGIPITITNCSNNYGPYHFPEKLIPLVILNALEGKSLPVYGDGKYTRDWLFVEDHATAIWAVVTNGRVGETYNIGGNSEKQNLEVINSIITIIDELAPPLSEGSRKNLIRFVRDRPGHDRRYAIDARKIKTDLAWEPSVSFEEGIKKTIQWYLDNLDWVESVRTGEYKNWLSSHYRE